LGYTGRVSAKQALLEFVQHLSEEEAEELLWVTDLADDDWPQITPEAMAAIQRGMEDARAGRFVSHDDMRHRYGLDD
jgi:predicted transcriptional regulator